MNPVSLVKNDDLGREEPVSFTKPLPVTRGLEGTQVVATSGNVAAATATATLPAVAGKTNYISGFEITGAGATAAAVVDATVAGLIGGVTLHYSVTAPAGVTTPITPTVVHFDPPIPASAPNTAISVSVPSLGAGNTNTAVNVEGFVR